MLEALIEKFGIEKLQGLLDGTHYISTKNLPLRKKGHMQVFVSELEIGQVYHVADLEYGRRGRLYGSAKSLGMHVIVRSAKPEPGVYIERTK